MRVSYLILVAILGTVASGTDAASDKTTTGAISALDPARCTVTLDDKSAYQFGTRCDFSKLKVGETIVIIWRQNGGSRQGVQVFVPG